MYDTFLSPQWIFDRCLEGATLLNPPGVFFTAFILSLVTFFFITRRRKISLFAYTIFTVLGIIPFLFILYAMGFGAYMLYDCSDGEFWPAINAAHKINEQLKNSHLYEGKDLPVSQSQFKDIDPVQYQYMIDNAKVKYIYESQDDSYTWFVRPSKHYVVVFDSKKDFSLYRLSNYMIHLEGAKNYPPSYDGPWDQLPE